MYSQKKIVFQVLSCVFVMFRTPFFSLSWLLVLNNIFTFNEIGSTYLKYPSLVSTCLAIAFLVTLCYSTSVFFNLQVPNDKLPWSETSKKPYLLGCIVKFLLVMAFKLILRSRILIYVIAVLALLTLLYKLYTTIYRSHLFDRTVALITLLLDLSLAHFLLFFLMTSIYSTPYYFFFVLAFLPCSCLAGVIIKE